MGTIQIMIKHRYKCCLSENIEEVETEEEDNNDRQIVTQLRALETDVNFASPRGDDKSEESFATTIPCNFKK